MIYVYATIIGIISGLLTVFVLALVALWRGKKIARAEEDKYLKEMQAALSEAYRKGVVDMAERTKLKMGELQKAMEHQDKEVGPSASLSVVASDKSNQ